MLFPLIYQCTESSYTNDMSCKSSGVCNRSINLEILRNPCPSLKDFIRNIIFYPTYVLEPDPSCGYNFEASSLELTS